MTWNNAVDRLNSAVLTTFGEKSAADGGEGRVTINGTEVDATFSRPYEEIPSGEVVHAGYIPRIEGKQSALETAGLDHGATVVVRGVTYTVVDLQPDGDGWIVARLEES